MTTLLHVFISPIFAMTVMYGIANKTEGNIYVIINSLVIFFPIFGKNLTIPYAPKEEIITVITVLTREINRLFLIFLIKFSSNKTCL